MSAGDALSKVNQNLGLEDLKRIIDLQQDIVTADLALPELKQLVCEKTQEFTHATGAVVEMHEGDFMVYRACTGTLANSLGLKLNINTSLSGMSVLKAEVLYCRDSEVDDRVDREACRKVGARSMICVPLIRQGNAVGVLKVVAPNVDHFSEREVGVLRLVAGLLSTLIGQAVATDALNKANEALRKSELAARVATQAKSEFLANMSHEIRTPLNGVIGITELLADTQLQTEQKDYVQIIKGSANTLLALLNDILDFSKIEAHKLNIESIDFDLRSLFLDTIRILAVSSSQKGLVLENEVESTVPQHVYGDPTRLRQILMNLGSNAIKFTSKGSVKLSLKEIKSTNNSSLLRCEVKDTGIGIPLKALEAMFKPFSQVDTSTTRRFGGTGLGLSICKQLVELMGGRIGVESVEGQGSIFWFEIELKKVDAAAQAMTAGASSTIHGGTVLQVLIAEDNDVNALIARKAVEKMGYHVTIAKNGKEVLDLLEKSVLEAKAFDLILMDCQMPEMDGYQASREIRSSSKAFKALPIIAMTANALQGDREKCLGAGMNDYISKPMKASELQSLIHKVLGDKV